MHQSFSEAIVTNPIDDTSQTCGELESNGEAGQIEVATCTNIANFIQAICGCSAAGDNTTATEAPDTEPPSVTDPPSSNATEPPTTNSTVPPPGTYPACSVCGEGLSVTDL
jgi:hypothetical protein